MKIITIFIFIIVLWSIYPAGASFNITPQDGAFPVSVGAKIPAAVFVDDINGDGFGEIVVETYDNIFMYDYTGSRLWSAGLTGAHMTLPKMPNPVAGNIAGDSKLEVVFGDKSSKKLYVWNSDGTTVSGFPKTLAGNIFSTPALADVDDDGYLEIAIGCDSNLVYLIDGNGNDISGWPVAVGGNVRSQPAFGDIDDDGELEIIVTSSSYDGNDLLFSAVYAFNLDGTNVTGWPKDIKALYGTGTRYTSPAVDDLDNDGIDEVVIASTYEYSNAGKVIAFDGDGSELWVGSTTLNPYSSPVIGDMDRDPYNEVVVGGLWKVFAFEHDGTLKWINSIGDGNEVDSIPRLIDITGDGIKEAFVSTKNSNIYGWYGDATSFMYESAVTEVYGAPSIYDFDGDGLLEVIVGTSTGYLYAWNIEFIPVYPVASITSPADGSIFIQGDTITLVGNGSDPDGTIMEGIWRFDVDSYLGSGETLRINSSTLDVGYHSISYTVYDRDGLSNTSSITIKIKDDVISGGGGVGGGFTGEDLDNIEVSESVSQFVLNGKRISYEFKNVDPILNVEFTALRSAGTITAVVEVLHDTSSLIANPAPYNVYKNVNIYVGLSGYATEQNIRDATVSFRVDKNWIESNNIDESTVALFKYSNGSWVEQPTELESEDNTYIYYKAHVKSFSQFAISGREWSDETIPQSDEINGKQVKDNSNQNLDINEFDILSGMNKIYLLIGISVICIMFVVMTFLRKRPNN